MVNLHVRGTQMARLQGEALQVLIKRVQPYQMQSDLVAQRGMSQLLLLGQPRMLATLRPKEPTTITIRLTSTTTRS